MQSAARTRRNSRALSVGRELVARRTAKKEALSVIENIQDRKSITDAHGVYLIRVLGELDSRWLDYFDGISIVVNASEGRNSISTLCTHDSDQAAVMGILNSLYQFGYPLLYLQLLRVQ